MQNIKLIYPDGNSINVSQNSFWNLFQFNQSDTGIRAIFRNGNREIAIDFASHYFDIVLKIDNRVVSHISHYNGNFTFNNVNCDKNYLVLGEDVKIDFSFTEKNLNVEIYD